MSDITIFEAEKREKAGKGAARAVRRAGMIPAVVYGDKKAPMLISVSPKQLLKEMNKGGFWTRQFEVKVGGKKTRTICHDIQLHPVTDVPLHVDFLRISKDSELTIAVPVKVINEEGCPGIKLGGVLNIVRREIEVVCKAADIPSDITIDLTGGKIGDSIKMSNINLPKGVKPSISDRDFTVLTLVAPTTSGDASEEGAEEGAEEVTSEE